MFFLKLKQFVKTPVLVLTAVVYFAWIIKKLLPGFYSELGDIASGITFPLVFIPVSFVFFIFFSYALFSRDAKRHVEEVLLTCRNGKMKSCLCDLCLIFLFQILLLFLFLLYLGVQCTKATGGVSMSVFWFGVRCFVIHIILLNLFAALIGMTVSFMKKEIRAIAVMILCCCFFSQFFLEAFYQLAGKSENLQHIMDLFGLTTRMYYASPDYDYIFSVESVDLQRILFWIFLLAGILNFLTLQGKKRLAAAVCEIMAVCCLMLYLLPSGASYVNDTNTENVQDAWNDEGIYYQAHTEQTGTLDQCGTKENFKITKYVADLSINRVLKADVEVYVNQKNLDAYTFSLRHEYKLRSVEDEYGKNVDYSQNGDWITLSPKDSREHTKFIFHYRGASKLFYSTSQAIRLPAYFAYLPFSGKQYLHLDFSRYDEELETTWQLYSGTSLEGLGYEAEYDITVHSSLPVYSNIEQVASGHFHGVSDGATLVANTFLEKKEVSGVTIVYSKADPGYSAAAGDESEKIQKWKEFIEENKIQGKTIFALGVVYGAGAWDTYTYFGEDHLVLTVPCTDQYRIFLKTGEHPYYEEENIW